jgi:hypothetical protein
MQEEAQAKALGWALKKIEDVFANSAAQQEVQRIADNIRRQREAEDEHDEREDH